HDSPCTDCSPLSLHAALPISPCRGGNRGCAPSWRSPAPRAPSRARGVARRFQRSDERYDCRGVRFGCSTFCPSQSRDAAIITLRNRPRLCTATLLTELLHRKRGADGAPRAMGKMGLEPIRIAPHDPKSCSSASSATSPEGIGLHYKGQMGFRKGEITPWLRGANGASTPVDQWQRERERAPLAGRAIDLDRRAHPIGEQQRQRQPDPGAFVAASRRAVYLVERLEDVLLLLVRDANAVIFHREPDAIAFCGRGDQADGRVFRAELERVFE